MESPFSPALIAARVELVATASAPIQPHTSPFARFLEDRTAYVNSRTVTPAPGSRPVPAEAEEVAASYFAVPLTIREGAETE